VPVNRLGPFLPCRRTHSSTCWAKRTASEPHKPILLGKLQFGPSPAQKIFHSETNSIGDSFSVLC
jgi:hypothetical protein